MISEKPKKISVEKLKISVTLIEIVLASVAIILLPRLYRNIVILILIGGSAAIWLPDTLDTLKRIIIGVIISLSLLGLYTVDSRETKKQINELQTRINKIDSLILERVKEIENLRAERDFLISEKVKDVEKLHFEKDSLILEKDKDIENLRAEIENLKSKKDDEIKNLNEQIQSLSLKTIFFKEEDKKRPSPDDHNIDQIQLLVETSKGISEASGENLTVSLFIDKYSFYIDGNRKNYFAEDIEYSFDFKLPEQENMKLDNLQRSIIILSHNCKDKNWHIDKLVINLKFKNQDGYQEYRRWKKIGWLGTGKDHEHCPAAIILQPERSLSAITPIFPIPTSIMQQKGKN